MWCRSLPLLLLYRLPHVKVVSQPPYYFVLSTRTQGLVQLTHFHPRLVNYTPQATVVRLLTVNAVNGYLTSWALYLIGGAEDPRLLLPAWIGISTVRPPFFLHRYLIDRSGDDAEADISW